MRYPLRGAGRPVHPPRQFRAHKARLLGARSPSPHRQVLRARIALAAAEGRSNDQTAHLLRPPPNLRQHWRERFAFLRHDGLWACSTRTGRRPHLSTALVGRIVRSTISGSPRWETLRSTRSLACHLAGATRQSGASCRGRGSAPSGPVIQTEQRSAIRGLAHRGGILLKATSSGAHPTTRVDGSQTMATGPEPHGVAGHPRVPPVIPRDGRDHFLGDESRSTSRSGRASLRP